MNNIINSNNAVLSANTLVNNGIVFTSSKKIFNNVSTKLHNKMIINSVYGAYGAFSNNTPNSNLREEFEKWKRLMKQSQRLDKLKDIFGDEMA